VIGEKQTTRPIESLAQRLARIVLTELPVWQLLVLAAAAGALWAASLFDWSFVTGQHAFWQFPKGTIGGGPNDMALYLAAYLYYVQSPWQLPLFYVSAFGTPAGTNVILTDFVPIVALIGKLVHSLTGATTNLYGAFLFLCFALPGVMMTLVLIAARIRYGLAALIAGIFANAMPALLYRWGHTPLEAHYLLIGALALYLFSLKKPAWRGLAAGWIAYLVLAYLTNPYLFAMVGTVWVCTVIQRRLNGLATTREALGIGVLTVALVTTVVTLGGQFGGGSGPPFSTGYGLFSMNLLSPLVPQDSGLFPGLGGVIDATGGQYEGFNYLGVGLLLASLLVLPAEAGWLRRNLRRHVALLVAFATLTAFAISHRVFAGHWLLFEVPIPRYIVWALGILRGSGRFFWLIGYAQMAIVIVLGFRCAQPVMALCLVGAAILQLFDVQPLREQIIASIAAPGAEELDRDEVARLIARARHVEAVPSFQCSIGLDQQQKMWRANMELMLATARMNVPTNTVYLVRHFGIFGVTLLDVVRAPSRALEMMMARRDQYCNQEIEYARSSGRPGDVIVLLSDRPRTEEMAAGVTCSPLSWARYCERSKQ
jgi:hypothetical protein